MQISKYETYLVSTRLAPMLSRIVSTETTGDKLPAVITPDTVDISIINTYEIYTKNPDTGATGWDIQLIRSIDCLIRQYPNFDCIITKNDSPVSKCIDFLDFKANSL